MPYIIVVNQPGYLPDQDPYAVADIEDARASAANEVDWSLERLHEERGAFEGLNAYERAGVEAADLPDTGGVIGPLPDGYVIDVRKTTYAALRTLAGLDGVELYGLRDERRDQILNAFGARRF